MIVSILNFGFRLESNITDAGDENQPLKEKKSRNSCPSDKYLEIPTRKSTPGKSFICN